MCMNTLMEEDECNMVSNTFGNDCTDSSTKNNENDPLKTSRGINSKCFLSKDLNIKYRGFKPNCYDA